eukprot:gene9930-13358_t
MPSLVRIKIEKGRDLPIMDSTAVTGGEASTDSFVEIKLDNQVQRTNTCRRTLNPVWNEEFRFEVTNDSVLQDAPVELKCMDNDLYSSELIGVVYIDLNPLIMRTTTLDSEKDLIIHGWLPLFDTLRGVRGALLVSVKLQFIGNENAFRDSSAGVQFFSASTLSTKCFYVQEILGFVEDLVVEDDPESSWQDYFRKGNKASNDIRLKVLYNISAEVRRELGKKVLDIGGNAVLGYSVHFDIEGSSGIVARAYGTACKLLKVAENSSYFAFPRGNFEKISAQGSTWSSLQGNGGGSIAAIQRDIAEILSPKLARSLSNNVGNSAVAGDVLILLQAIDHSHGRTIQLFPFGVNQDKVNLAKENTTILFHPTNRVLSAERASSGVGNAVVENDIFQAEIQFLSLKTFHPNIRVKLGGLVLARSVKFLGKLEATLSDQETRDGWWQELREEIRSHAKTLCCKHIIGYSETCTVFGDVCILSAVGTAAVLKGLSYPVTHLSSSLPLLRSQSAEIGGILADSLEDMNDQNNSDNELIYGDNTVHQHATSDNDVDDYDVEDNSFLRNDDYKGISTPIVRSTDTNENMKAGQINSKDDSSSFKQTQQTSGGHSQVVISGLRRSSDISAAGSTPIKLPTSGHRMSISNEKNPQLNSKISNSNNNNNNINNSNIPDSTPLYTRKRRVQRPCAFTHVPYNHNTAPFSFMRLVPCLMCKRKWVPETILATNEPPKSFLVRGKGTLLESKVCRNRRSSTGESDAVKISEALPFVEFELQRQIILKLKILGMNSAFGYSCRIQVGGDMIIATAACTAVYLESLPPPPTLQITRHRDGRNEQNDLRLQRLQNQIIELTHHYKSLLDESRLPKFDNYKHQQQIGFMQVENGSEDTSNRLSGGSSLKGIAILNKNKKVILRKNNKSPDDSSVTDASVGFMLSEDMVNPPPSYPSRRGSGNSHNDDDHETKSVSTGSSASSSSDSDDDSNDSSLENPSHSSYSGSEDDQEESATEKDDNSSSAAGDEEEATNKLNTDRRRSSTPVQKENRSTSAPSPGDRKRKPSIESNHAIHDNSENYDENGGGRNSRINSVNQKSIGNNSRKASIKQQSQKPFTQSYSQQQQANLQKYRKAKKRIIFKDDRPPFLFEIDDETDSDIVAVLSDWFPPNGIDMVNLSFVPGESQIPVGFGRNISILRRGKISQSNSNNVMMNSTNNLNKNLQSLFRDAYLRLCFSVKFLMPCQVLGLNHAVNILEDGFVEVLVNAMVHKVVSLSSIPTKSFYVKGVESYVHKSHSNENYENSYTEKEAASSTFHQRERSFGSTSSTNPSRSQSFDFTNPNRAYSISSSTPQPLTESSTATAGSVSEAIGLEVQGYNNSNSERLNPDDNNMSSAGGTIPSSGGSLRIVNETVSSSNINLSKLETIDETSSLNLSPLLQHRVVSTSSEVAMAGSESPKQTFMDLYAATWKYLPSSVSNSAESNKMNGSFQPKGELPFLSNTSSGFNNNNHIIITSLSEIPGTRVRRYLGPVQLHFIKDSWSIRGEGALGAFFYLFISEANAVARSQVAALGGNALLCHRLIPQESGGRVSRNQVYNMLSVTGDAVLVDYIVEQNIYNGNNNNKDNNTMSNSNIVSSDRRESVDWSLS